MPLESGSVFAGHTIERVLGVGGMGVVYLARHPRLERSIALKVLSTNVSEDGRVRARFEREALLAARLDHPDIVPVYDRSGPESDTLWISMKHVPGGDVAQLLARSGGPLPPPRAVRLITGAAYGLDYAHQHGVLHRDVKPANILVEQDERGQERAVLTDFGIARAFDEAETTTGTTASFAYVAPERLRGEPVETRADVYSLGCTLYEMLTGSTPFPRASPGAMIAAHLNEQPPRPSLVRPGLPPGFDAVIATALAKRPADRFPTCVALAEAAARVMDEAQRRTTVNPRPGPPFPSQPQPQPQPIVPPPGPHTGPPPGRHTGPPPGPHTGIPPGPYPGPQPGPHTGPPPYPPVPQPYPPQRSGRGRIVAVAMLMVVLAVGGVLTGVYLSRRHHIDPIAVTTTTPPAATPGIQLLDDGVRIGVANAPTTIDMFNEPICPPCGKLLTNYSPDIQSGIDSGRLAVRFHLLHFLDDSSASRNYSTRAVAATRCVAQSGDAMVYLKTYQGLFTPAFQPAENGRTDHTDLELAQLARSVGASSATTDCITSGRLMDLARATADQGEDKLDQLEPAGFSTPAVFQGTVKVDTGRSDWVTRLN
ncbi:serine/threonine protein kinase PknE [Nocardia aurantia]|uniref:non-specific serine/threonine protein kinase n=1 Tax=Nocardia aurantia TaxID=2585199 RepID=A0A7K0DUD6_9NOCA|nr:protein kinase [Nocardia aurantia]MQY28992.1 Serine/threonine-protein kinase PknE [Nocardia aurantia]